MRNIPAPGTMPGHPDHQLDCEAAIESEFLALAGRAEAAGWDSDTVAAALQNLACSYGRGRKALDEMDEGLTVVHTRILH
jgi:hypothetical protein